MYPLRFNPIFRRYLWGGRRLADVLNKPIGLESCAESWEIVDHNDSQSVVTDGKLSGSTLTDLIKSHPDELLGPAVSAQISNPSIPLQLRNRFPLLLKFLDAHRALSVQVHPDDKLAATLDPPDLGKTEAWYVMHAEPGAKIYAGLKEGITAKMLRLAIENDFTEEALHSFEPVAGDCVYIRAGTMHAIGAGLLIAEIQQSSDTTFRVFDWNRTDDQGQPRPLHIEPSIQATNFELGPINPVCSKDNASNSPGTTLIECEKFVLRRWTIEKTNQLIEIGGDERFHILAVVKGSVVVENDPSQQAAETGQTLLLPAAVGRTAVSANEPAVVLDIFVP